MTDSTTPAPDDSKPPRKNSAQDKAIAAYITAAEVFLGTASGDAEIRPLLEARGYDAAEFSEGIALAIAARTAFEERAGGMGGQSQATVKLNEKIRDARDDYARFREIARPSFPDRADRLALGLTGDVPEDTGRFITAALASYAAAGKEPQAAKLAKRGYPAATLAPLVAALNDITSHAADQDQAEGAAIGDTAARDQAYDDLREFMKELKGVAKGALRGKPGLLAKLGLN